MIQAGNTELDNILKALTEQRNSAMDAVAVLTGRLAVQEALSAELQKKLNEALKPPESGDKETA